MTSSREATLGIGLAFFFAACSSPSPSSQTPGGGSGVGGGAQTAGTNSGNSAGTNSGNSAGTNSGNSAGSGGSTSTNGGGSGTTAGTSAGGSASAGANGQAGGSSTAGSGTVVVNLPDLVTSADGAFWKTGTLTPVTSGTADVTADDTSPNSLKQRWDGFGGTFNEAGWDALMVLSESDRQLALSYLFDAANGANFAYGRLPIGASDYAMSRYTLDDSTTADYTMASFSIEHDKKLLIPYIKAAKAIKSDIHFWASPWTPPGWMKSNNSIDSGNMKDDDKTLAAFALYLKKYVQAYAGEGLTIEAVHPQNEPGYSPPYPSCGWTEALYIKFIRDYLGPLFAKDNIPAQIWCGTMSNQTDGTIATNLAKDAKAMTYVKGFGLQWNTRGSISALKSTNQPIMQTEHKCGNYDFATDYWSQSSYDPSKPQNDYAYGVESWKNIKDWVVAGVNSYSAWNMVLDTLGTNLNTTKPWHQNALLVVDRAAKKLTATPAYYVFRHLSQFAAPKATVIGTSGGDALAFKNPDGAFVVVMYNSGAAKKMIVSLGGTKFQFDMPGNGWATVHHMK
ncbi:MAG: glycoside hydrolase family 30 beta sandwich domain-containing protein [Pseudomonadota bacterium]